MTAVAANLVDLCAALIRRATVMTPPATASVGGSSAACATGVLRSFSKLHGEFNGVPILSVAVHYGSRKRRSDFQIHCRHLGRSKIAKNSSISVWFDKAR